MAMIVPVSCSECRMGNIEQWCGYVNVTLEIRLEIND